MVSLVTSMGGFPALMLIFYVLHKYYTYDTALQCHYRFLASKQRAIKLFNVLHTEMT